MGMAQEFKEFAMRGNVVDMAIGIVIGGAFGKIVSSFVSDVIMPVVGKITGGVDFSTLTWVIQEGSTGPNGEEIPTVAINYGTFFNTLIDFLIIAFAIFLVVKAMNKAKKQFEEKKEEAPAAPPEDIQLLREIRDSLAK